MPDLQARLREDLTTALRARDRVTAGVLRTALSAIANAEAQPAPADTPVSLRTEGVIAGAATGLGAADVARRELTAADVRTIVAGERDERLASAADLDARGAAEAAAALRTEAALLDQYLD
ncbi:GatB/YqeY domain-containing protein [Nocardioides sp. SR21]|uniref:GatB/YqeY domain-containing protein n=1 Tax=Nocardioides sp. SR21 TaxID=2919501 RepID=UPI001FAAFD5A|nr:GatB/YqeY domain-containing protein [Nocardioides sp. SR21]